MSESGNSEPSLGGVKLRWWQQGEAADPPVYRSALPETAQEAKTSNPSTAAATLVPDIGEELEAEAHRLAIAEANGERVTIYPNVALNIAKLHRRLMRAGVMILPFMLAMGLLLSFMIHAIWPLIAIGLLVSLEIAVLYTLMRRFYARQREPVIRLTDDGIEIHSYGYDLGLVRWNEISDIQTFKAVYRYIGISLRDVDAFCAARPRTNLSLIRMNSREFRLRRRNKRRPTLHIMMSDENLPLSTDVLLAKINAFRAARGV